jgi:hypothetical protein
MLGVMTKKISILVDKMPKNYKNYASIITLLGIPIFLLGTWFRIMNNSSWASELSFLGGILLFLGMIIRIKKKQ